jgi:hypothetical protein
MVWWQVLWTPTPRDDCSNIMDHMAEDEAATQMISVIETRNVIDESLVACIVDRDMSQRYSTQSDGSNTSPRTPPRRRTSRTELQPSAPPRPKYDRDAHRDYRERTPPPRNVALWHAKILRQGARAHILVFEV